MSVQVNTLLKSLNVNRPLVPPLRGFARDAKFTEGFFLFLFADPGGIGSAFHRAEEAEKK